MANESIHACDCSNGFTYVGEITIGKASGLGAAATHHEDIALSRYFVIPTKTLIERTWVKYVGDDDKEHLKYVPYVAVASTLYSKLRAAGTLNRNQVKLPHVDANHELEV